MYDMHITFKNAEISRYPPPYITQVPALMLFTRTLSHEDFPLRRSLTFIMHSSRLQRVNRPALSCMAQCHWANCAGCHAWRIVTGPTVPHSHACRSATAANSPALLYMTRCNWVNSAAPSPPAQQTVHASERCMYCDYNLKT